MRKQVANPGRDDRRAWSSSGYRRQSPGSRPAAPLMPDVDRPLRPLAAWAPVGRPARDRGAAQPAMTAGSARVPRAAVLLYPARLAGDAAMPGRFGEYLYRGSGELGPLAPAQVIEAPGRMDPGAPEDLVGELVADPGDHPLIHQRRLGPTAAPVEQVLHLAGVQVARVRAE